MDTCDMAGNIPADVLLGTGPRCARKDDIREIHTWGTISVSLLRGLTLASRKGCKFKFRAWKFG